MLNATQINPRPSLGNPAFLLTKKKKEKMESYSIIDFYYTTPAYKQADPPPSIQPVANQIALNV